MTQSKLIQGDAKEELIRLSGIDTIITDPPYGLSFMGKHWDYDVPSVEFWKVALASTKSGGTALVFAGSRTYHRMACNMEDAGWVLKDCIMWLYGSGFPKATDISKQIDKRGGANHLADECAKQLKVARESRGITKKQADEMFCGGTTNYSWFEGRPAGQRLPSEKEATLIMNEWGELKPLLEKIAQADREVIGKKKMLAVPVSDQLDGWGVSNEVDITISKTSEAQLWNGWKSHGLKPAYEPIIVAMKPNDGTYANNALKHGVAGLNIDGGRIEADKDDVFGGGGLNSKDNGFIGKSKTPYEKGMGFRNDNATGRFPANIILETSYEQVLTLIDSNDTIEAYYENYEVPTMWERVSDLSEQGGEVLPEEVLQPSSKELPITNEREEAQQESNSQDEQTKREKSEVSGVVLQQGVQVSELGGTNTGTTNDSKDNDDKGSTTRTQDNNGVTSSKTIGSKRGSSSQERNKRRQSVEKLGDDGQCDSQDGTQSSNKRTTTLEVLSGDVPETWLRYFRPTGYSVISPRCSSKMLDEQSGELKSGDIKPHKQARNNIQMMASKDVTSSFKGDKGGASRFFYCAKASKKERNKGLDSTVSITIEYEVWNDTKEINEVKKVQLLVATDKPHQKVTGVYGAESKNATEWNTVLFGNCTTEKYQEVNKSTTKTETNLITISATLKWLIHLLTNEYTLVVNCEGESGGSPAVNAENCNTLITTTNEKMVSVLGVRGVVSGTQLKISVGEGSNVHSTVKPLALMEYLVKLTATPTGGTVCDPFMGSGTTGIACKNQGRDFIGIEREEEYMEIAKARLCNQTNQN